MPIFLRVGLSELEFPLDPCLIDAAEASVWRATIGENATGYCLEILRGARPTGSEGECPNWNPSDVDYVDASGRCWLVRLTITPIEMRRDFSPAS